LLAAQTASYGSYLDTGRFQILSASPELFFQRHGDEILCRPMKGTAARGRWWEEDQALVAALRTSPKEQAENVMIVDLIRNDLGRVARFGSVQVDELFAVEQYETVWQLVSSVSAELSPTTSTVDLFRALFPCGSVTGAPKVRTMEIIAELETSPRGVYCGAIGMLSPPASGRPEAQFSVAIRTVTIDAASSLASYGIGGGITYDSQIDREYEETRTKARVLVRKPAEFDLLETMRWEPASGIWFLDEHLDRLERSADYCGYRFDRSEVEKQLLAAIDGHPPALVRMTLDPEGTVGVQIDPLVEPPASYRVAVDSVQVDPTDWRLYHKTSLRTRYREARRRHPDADEVLMVNNSGYVTEATTFNVIVKLGGEWVTPPVSSGCLPGVMRRVLLENGEVRESPISVSDLAWAEGLELVNSVRLRIPATIIDPKAAPTGRVS
jgi:para-aminobenzoate synthetase/4-amino-4-deoxychorismate lyase